MFEFLKSFTQGTKEWIEFRRKHITSTDAGKIMEEVPSSWGTPYTLWYDKITGRENFVNKAMKKGIIMEPVARRLYEEEIGESFDPAVIKSTDIDYMAASLDGLSADSKKVVEIKCGKSAHESAKNGDVKQYYKPQLQHILAITGLEYIDYCSYWEGDLIIIPVSRDEAYIKELIKMEEVFYECLTNMKEPPCTLEVYEEETSFESLSIKLNLEKAISQKKELEREIESYRKELFKIADGRNIKIDNMKLKKCLRSGSVKYKDIPELKGVDLDMYRKDPTEYYTITF